MTEEEFLDKQKKLIALCPEADKVIFALKQYLGVTFFRYVKSFPNGEKFIVCNNEAWLKAYFKEKFYQKELADFKKHPVGSRGSHIHHPCTRDHPACNFWRAHSDIGDYTCFVYFFVKFKDYLEAYNFGLNGDAHKTNDTFFNNQHIFRHFFLYFRSHGQELLKNAYDARFLAESNENYNLQDNWLLGINEQLTKVVIQEMPLQQIYLDDEYENISFTVNEANSLKCFLEGYSMQQGAEILHISETSQINNLGKIMDKLQVKGYNDLRTLCLQHNIALKLTFLNKNVT